MYSTMQKYNLNQFITTWLSSILPKDYIQSWDYNTSTIQLEQSELFDKNSIGSARSLPSAVVNIDPPKKDSESEVVHSNLGNDHQMFTETIFSVYYDERRVCETRAKYIPKTTSVTITINSKNIGESYTIKDLISSSYVMNFKTVPQPQNYIVPIEVGSIIINNNQKLYNKVVEYLSHHELPQIQISSNPLDNNNKILTSNFEVNPLINVTGININHSKTNGYSTVNINLELDYQEVIYLQYYEDNIVKDIQIIISE